MSAHLLIPMAETQPLISAPLAGNCPSARQETVV
ncbi:hypothetical protein FHS39_001711 [Streptomyces olivoverticillatus]|uniref:Uncharacterized protein n=1 Tax=Streptomyces olivoverticillatus TaxID=66427 RepID=A0A7W7PLD4_9ACTN|nr:hypothetical protein [Streptomyces olivoverticillatus]